MEKYYISANELLDDSFKLGMKILHSGFRPDFIVGVWRGGTPVGIAVQEIMEVCGITADHIAIRTASYIGIGKRTKEVEVHGLDYLLERLRSEHSLLIVDDVFDSGLSINAIIRTLHERLGDNTPGVIRSATPWYKPGNNKTDTLPDYYLYETDQWLVFPHEIDGLTEEEIALHKPEVAELMKSYRSKSSN